MLISIGLLARLREAGKPFARISCDVYSKGPPLFVARRIAGEPFNESEEYPSVEITATNPDLEVRLACLFCEPPKDDSPMGLSYALPLGEARQNSTKTSQFQPYVEAILKKEKRILIVGTSEVQLISSRPSLLNAERRLWYRGTVIVPPPKPTVAGIDPAVLHAPVGLIGLGSIGSRVAKLLSAAGARQFVFVDPDRLECRNLRRHLCGPSYVGSLKVDAVNATLSQDGFDVSVEKLVRSLPREDSDSTRRKLSKCALLVCCADSAAAQQYANHLARKLNIPAVIASIKLLPQALGEVVLTQPHVSGCLNCWRIAMREQELIIRADAHDLGDYPDSTEATPRGLPAYHLDQVAAVATDFCGRALAGTSPRTWLNAMQSPVDGFDDLEVQCSAVEEIAPQLGCLVCGL